MQFSFFSFTNIKNFLFLRSPVLALNIPTTVAISFPLSIANEVSLSKCPQRTSQGTLCLIPSHVEPQKMANHLRQCPGSYEDEPGITAIAVMGVTGSGKSNFIRLAMGSDGPEVGHDLGSRKLHPPLPVDRSHV